MIIIIKWMKPVYVSIATNSNQIRVDRNVKSLNLSLNWNGAIDDSSYFHE